MAGPHDTLSVREMEESKANDLLKKLVIAPEILDDTRICAQLLYQLTYLPLAIVQAAAFINSNKISIAKYILLLEETEESTISMLSKDFEDKGQYRDLKNSVATTWLISFQQVQKHNTVAAEYLSFMSCLDTTGIPQDFLPKTTTRKDMLDAIGTLSAYSLITKRSSSSSIIHSSNGNPVFDLHRLVRLAIRNWLRLENKLVQWTERAITRLVDIFPSYMHKNRAIWSLYLPHALCLCSSGLLRESEERNRLLTKVVLCLLAEGKYQEAKQSAIEALQVREKVLGMKHPDTLTSISNLGSVLRDQGNYKAAEEMDRQALEGREEVLGKEHLDTLTSINNLALALQYQGNYKEAEEMYRQVLEGYKMFRKEHPYALSSMNNLALVLQNQGNYKAAEEMNRQVLKGREKVLGKEHPETLTSISNLASVLRDQGNYKDAEEMDRRALEGREKILGKEHPETLISKSNLALVLQYQGNYKLAEEMHQQVLEGREKVLGKEHPDTLTSLNNLALVLHHQGNYDIAKEMHQQALEGREKVLGKEHPDTLTSMDHLAIVLYNQGDHKATEEINWQILEKREKLLGKEHPETLANVYNLAFIFHRKGQYNDALSLYQRAYAGYEKVLGPDHPTARECMDNYLSLQTACGLKEVGNDSVSVKDEPNGELRRMKSGSQE